MASRARAGSGGGLSQATRQQFAGWIFIAPVVILLGLFLLVPVLMAAWVSVSDWSGRGSPFSTEVAFVGGDNYVSQYFHYGHYAIDIAADYGSRVRAAAGGTVTFAGWKSNGGGYQVWINHGNGIYSAHHHMSAVLVSTGDFVAKCQRVGRLEQSGWASGPHDHFEVWVGRPWESGSYRVNPLRYY